MAKKPLILVDFDDCLVNTHVLVEKWANEHAGRYGIQREIKLTSGDNWEDVVNVLGVAKNCQQIAYRDMLTMLPQLINVPEFQAIDGAHEVLTRLSEKFDIAVLTSRPRLFERENMEQVAKFYAGLVTDVYSKDSVVRDDEVATKSDCCKYLGAEWLIDNQERHTLIAAREGTKSITFGTRDSRQVGMMPLWHCPTWQDIEQVILSNV